MKILAIICEFNPFHNGHKYLIDTAKRVSGCDSVLCIMSGSFSQRGDMCVLDKYVRARHAILGGADCVIQLPACFSVAPAEVFAKGAIKILSSIPDVKYLAFGCEKPNKKNFLSSAKLALTENEEFKNIISTQLEKGDSYIKSYSAAFSACGGDCELIENPNNILGLEYTKAILSQNACFDIMPIERIGCSYNDNNLSKNYSSASAIRQNMGNEKIKENVPYFVFEDLKGNNFINEYKNALRLNLFNAQPCELKKIYGCGEGLENRLKNLQNEEYDKIISLATNKRYSSSRIKRILCANMLGLYQEDTEKFLKSDLYIKSLGVKKECSANILSSLSKSTYPLVCGVSDENLSTTAKICFERDKFEYSIFKHICNLNNKDYMITV